MTEYVGLRAKMYAIRLLNESFTIQEKQRAKGIQRALVKKMRFDEFKAQLDHPEENRLLNQRIANKLHHIYTLEVYALFIFYFLYTLFLVFLSIPLLTTLFKLI